MGEGGRGRRCEDVQITAGIRMHLNPTEVTFRISPINTFERHTTPAVNVPGMVPALGELTLALRLRSMNSTGGC